MRGTNHVDGIIMSWQIGYALAAKRLFGQYSLLLSKTIWPWPQPEIPYAPLKLRASVLPCAELVRASLLPTATGISINDAWGN